MTSIDLLPLVIDVLLPGLSALAATHSGKILAFKDAG
jgi:hypothetical protein